LPVAGLRATLLAAALLTTGLLASWLLSAALLTALLLSTGLLPTGLLAVSVLRLRLTGLLAAGLLAWASLISIAAVTRTLTILVTRLNGLLETASRGLDLRQSLFDIALVATRLLTGLAILRQGGLSFLELVAQLIDAGRYGGLAHPDLRPVALSDPLRVAAHVHL